MRCILFGIFLFFTAFYFYLFFKRLFIYLFLERGEEREKERKGNINMWSPLMCPSNGDLAHNPGMCPDWESNRWPFASQSGAQSTEPHQPGLSGSFLCLWIEAEVEGLSIPAKSAMYCNCRTYLFSLYPHPRTFFSLFFERERKGERETLIWERETSVGCLPYAPGPCIGHAWTGEQTHNLGMCPDWDSNLPPFGYGMTLQTTEPPWQGPDLFLM